MKIERVKNAYYVQNSTLNLMSDGYYYTQI